MISLLREIAKTFVWYVRDTDYREYLMVKRKCRKVGSGQISLRIRDGEISGPDASALLHLYDETYVNRNFDVKSNSQQPVFIFVGANIGLEVLRTGMRSPVSRIIAVEPDPEIFPYLKNNVSCLGNKVELINAAAGLQEGTVAFASDKGLGGRTGHGEQQVKTISLKALLAAFHEIDLLSVDIEGDEFSVLKDAKEQLSKVKHLVVEWHGAEGRKQDLQDFLALLSACGFRYKLGNKLPVSPFINAAVEGGFDAMVEIYATQEHPQ